MRKILLTLLTTLLCSITALGTNYYIVCSAAEVPLTAGTTSTTQLLKTDGSTVSATTDISSNQTSTAGLYYNSTSSTYANLTNTSNYSTSSSDSRTIQGIKLKKNTTMTITLGSKTFSKMDVIYRCTSNDADKTLTIDGTDYTPGNSNLHKESIEKSFSTSITIENISNKEFNVFVILTEAAACTSITPTLSYSSTSLSAGGTSSSPTVSGNSGSGAVTYSVTASPSGCATINPSTGVVTGVTAGTATVTASIAAASTYCAGSATASFTITSCSTPTISTAPSSADYCQGDTPTALSFSGSGHNAQKWQYYDGDSWEDTGTTTATYSPSTSSTGSTQYRVVTTCDNYDTYYTASDAATVTVKTNPNLTITRK